MHKWLVAGLSGLVTCLQSTSTGTNFHWLLFKLRRSQAFLFSLMFPLFPFGRLLIGWLQAARWGRESHHFRGNRNPGLGHLPAPAAPHSPPRCPFPIKSLALSARVSLDNSFPSVRHEPSFGPWKGSPFLQQMATLVGLFFAETDILTTRDTQSPACLPMDQTQRPQLGPFCPWSPPDTDNWPECPD